MQDKVINFFKPARREKFTCLCCGYKTRTEKLPGTHEICGICFWEDDPVQSGDPDFEGAANKVSLKRAQKNFMLFGASQKEFLKSCRKPGKHDVKDPDFKPLEENKLKLIQIKNWKLVIDSETTRQAYEVVVSGAEQCGCEDCKWFAGHRDRVLRDEFKEVLKILGVDYKKDAEITCVDLAPDEKLYGGWYHAHGEVIEGEQSKPSMKGNAQVVKMKFVPLAPDFEILLWNKDDLAHKDFPRPVIQIEFSSKVKFSG